MKISVIVPVKNPDLGLLELALSSVFNQTYTDYEILLINDGSDAAYSEALKKLAHKSTSIRLFEIEPSGVSAARNYAALKADGDIVTYLDSDDFLSTVCFEEAVAVFENNDIDALWGGTIYGPSEELAKRKELNSEVALSYAELEKRLIVLDDKRKHQVKSECIGEPYRFGSGAYINRGIAARFIKKDKMLKSGVEFPLGIKFYEDAIWNLTMLYNLKVAYLDSEWYYYLENEKSVSNSYNPNIIDELEAPLAVIGQLIDMDNRDEYTGYTRLLMDSLRYISKCLYCNSKWDAGRAEKKKIKSHIYKAEPWVEIGTEKYKSHAQKSDLKKAFLYRKKILLFVWKYRWK